MDRGKQGGVEREMNFSLGKIIGRETRDERREKRAVPLPGLPE